MAIYSKFSISIPFLSQFQRVVLKPKVGDKSDPIETNRGFDGELVAFSVSLNTEC